jgi:hypothetical protein
MKTLGNDNSIFRTLLKFLCFVKYCLLKNEKKICIYLLQFLCVHQNYSQTCFSLIKFSVLLFKIKVIQLPHQPLGREKWNNFIEKKVLQNCKYLKLHNFDFLQTLQKFISIYGLQLPVSNRVDFCFVSKWRLFSKWLLKIGFWTITQ